MAGTPFITKSSALIRDQMLEHFLFGIVRIENEQHKNSVGNPTYPEDAPPFTYELRSGQDDTPAITNGVLVVVERVWGVFSGSFFEFRQNIDYTVDLTSNEITFSSGKEPDTDTIFEVSYGYDQQYSSGVTTSEPGSTTDLIFSPIAIQVAVLHRQLESARAAAFIETAQGDDLDDLVALLNVIRNASTKSSGFVQVSRSGVSGDVTIAAGATFASNATNTKRAVLFESTAAGIFLDGFSTARLTIEASTGYEGLEGNVAPNRIINVVSGANIIVVANPPNFQTYEFQDLQQGKYAYVTQFLPNRTINSTVVPGALLDKGIHAVMNFIDKAIDVNTGDWIVNPAASGDMTVTENDPETGTTKVVITDTGNSPYITLTGQSIEKVKVATATQGYDHIFVYMRGPASETFSLFLDATTPETSTPSLFKFPEQSSAVTKTLDTTFKLFYGLHGYDNTNESDPIDEVRIVFASVGTYFIDWIGIGTFLNEVTSLPLTSVDDVSTTYSSRTIGLSVSPDFFSPYDGDRSDGINDELLTFYEFKNSVGGGSDEETDIALRERAGLALAVEAKGTKEAIKGAVLDIDGIIEVDVSDFDDDPSILPGDVFVFVLAQGFVVSPALQQDIIDVVDVTRAAGIRASIFTPTIRYVNFTINLTYNDGTEEFVGTAGELTLSNNVSDAINNFFENAKINKNLYFSDLIGDIIDENPAILGGYVTFSGATEPTHADDDINGSYAFDAGVEVDNPNRIIAQSAGASVVVQRGNSVTISLTALSVE